MSQSDTTVKKLQVVLTGNTAQLQQAMNQAQKATDKATAGIQSGLNKVDSAFKKIAKTAAAYISVRALVSFGKQCVELGSDLTEVQNVVDTTFGSMASSIDNFAKSAITQFGLSETAAKRYSSTMGSMLKSMGMSTDQAYKMSTTLAGLAGDIASFYNLSADEAFAKIRSGISGQTEPLKQLGINLSVANLEAYRMSQGITKSYQSMTQAEQALLRYNYLLTATADAQGDFSRTADSWANQVKILQMNFQSLKATIGQGLIYALTPVIKMINTLMEHLQRLAEKFKLVMAIITGQDLNEVFGTGTSGAEASANLAADMGSVSVDADATSDSVDAIAEGMGDAAKEAKKFLLSFDEIHRLESDNETESTDNGDQINSLIDMSALSDLDVASDAVDEFKDNLPMSQDQIDALKNQFQPIIDMWENEIYPRIEKIGSALGDLYENHLKSLFSNIGDLASTLWDRVLLPFIDWVTGTAIPKLIELAGHAADVAGGVTQGANGIIQVLTAKNTEEKAEGGWNITKGIDDILKGIGGAEAWIGENIFGIQGAQEAFKQNWEKNSAMQNAHEFMNLFGNTSKTDFDLWQYVTPEMEKRMVNGRLTEDDMATILNEKYNPWGDLDYAKYNAQMTGDTAAMEALQALTEYLDEWKALDAAEHQGEIYGNAEPASDWNNDNPVVVAPTVDEYKDACKEGIREALDERQPTNITIEMSGREVGYGVADAMAVENVQFNPEVAVV